MDKKFAFQIIGLILLIFGALAVTFIYRGQTPFNRGTQTIFSDPSLSTVSEQKIVEIQDGTSNQVKASFNVEIADEPEERRVGLSGRDKLATGSGMLFIFDKADKYKFWMKGMRFPLDFIWINDVRVVDILPNMQPQLPNQPDEALPYLSPIVASDKVLEINAGDAQRMDIRVGDKIQIREATPNPDQPYQTL